MENPYEVLEKRLSNRFDKIEAMLLEFTRLNEKKANRVGRIDLAEEITKLSKHTIYKLAQRRLIPCSKPSGTKYLIFNEQELLNWINEGHLSTVSEIVDKQKTMKVA